MLKEKNIVSFNRIVIDIDCWGFENDWLSYCECNFRQRFIQEATTLALPCLFLFWINLLLNVVHNSNITDTDILLLC